MRAFVKWLFITRALVEEHLVKPLLELLKV